MSGGKRFRHQQKIQRQIERARRLIEHGSATAPALVDASKLEFWIDEMLFDDSPGRLVRVPK